MFSVYSLPNIILPILGGLLALKYGLRFMYILYAVLIAIGQLVFTVGCSYGSLYTMLIGRVIIGFGGECIGNCNSAMLVKWFSKSEVGFPLGVTISFVRLGSILGAMVAPGISMVYFTLTLVTWSYSPIVVRHWILHSCFLLCLYSLHYRSQK